MTDPTTDASPYVTLEEMAAYLKVSKSTFRAWLRQGRLPKATYIKFGRAYRFDREKVVSVMRDDRQMELPLETATTPSSEVPEWLQKLNAPKTTQHN